MNDLIKEDTVLEIKNIKKSFPGVVALSDVSFSVGKGEMRALSGENGAGKSTLIKILTGIYTRDSGEIIYKGTSVNFSSPKEAQEAGISTVYQELNLIPYLTVAENIFLGSFLVKKTGIDWKATERRAGELLKSLNLDINPVAALNTLGAASQQMVAIARALRDKNCNFLILDEPTSSLDTDEVEILFEFLRDLKSRGVSFLFITHRLEEIFKICDSVSVLKDGKYVGTYSIEELNQHKLVEYMIGHEVVEVAKRDINTAKADRSGDPIIELRHVKSGSVVKDMSFNIYPGEIVGLAGLLGSGRTETARVIYGCDKMEGGQIMMDGKEVRISSPSKALKQRIAFCTENRRVDGIIPNMDVKNNIVLNSLKAISKLGIINNKKRVDKVRVYIDKFNIKTPTLNQHIKFLSGGNQQKVMLARALASSPKLIILDEPTRGIDVGAKAEIEDLIHEVANSGIGVLFISSELTEVIRNCNRVIVVRDGRTIGELTGDDICMMNITQMIVNASRNQEEDAS